MASSNPTFSFGSSGFQFSAAASSGAAAGGGTSQPAFSFGSSAPAAGAAGGAFGGFKLGATASSGAAAGGGTSNPAFSFGSSAPAAAAPAAASAAPKSAFGGFGSAAPTGAAGATSKVAAPTGGAFSLGGAAAAPSSAASMAAAAPAATASSGSGFGFSVAAPAAKASSGPAASAASTGALAVSTGAPTGTSAAATSVLGGALELQRKPLDQIYKDWDKEDREIKAKFKQHCREMQELETAELAAQSQIDRLDKETAALERRQNELEKFIKNNIHTQSALESELAVMERRLDELLLAKESAAAHGRQMGQGQTDVSQRRKEMYEQAQALDVQVDMLSQEMVDLVERLNRSTEQKSTADDTVAKVEKILNEQYKTLHWGTPSRREPCLHQNTLCFCFCFCFCFLCFCCLCYCYCYCYCCSGSVVLFPPIASSQWDFILRCLTSSYIPCNS